MPDPSVSRNVSRPVESVDGVPTEHGDRCDAGVHAAVSWTYMRGEHADDALLRIRRALKEPRGWWNAQDEAEYQAILARDEERERRP